VARRAARQEAQYWIPSQGVAQAGQIRLRQETQIAIAGRPGWLAQVKGATSSGKGPSGVSDSISLVLQKQLRNDIPMPCQNHPQIDDGLVRCTRCAAELCPDCAVVLFGVPLCGPCKTERLLDRLSGIPGGPLDFAAISHRFLALLLDGLIVGLPFLVLAFGAMPLVLGRRFGMLGPFALQLVTLLGIPAGIVYHGWMLAARGQTLGKMALGIRVVNADGAPLRTGQAWGRAALQRLFVSCFSVLDYLPALLTPERTCIHDMAAKTRVVRALYRGPACPLCGAAFSLEETVAGPQICWTCAGSFEATPFAPPPLDRPPLALAEAGPAGGTACAVHAGNAAVGNCERCGLFTCSLCRVEVSGQPLCAACFDRLDAAKSLPALRNSFTDLAGLALLSGVLGLLFSVFGVVTGPLTLVLTGFAIRRRQRDDEGGGWGAILLAAGLGIAELGIGLFFLRTMFLAAQR